MNENRTEEQEIRCYEGSGPFIFASYSHAEITENDRNVVLKVLKHLDDDGYCIWFDKGIGLASEYPNVIYDHIKDCGLFLAFISRNFKQSIWCAHELMTAFHLNKRILPIYLDDSGEPPFVKSVGNLQSINFFEYTDIQKFCDKLCQTSEIGQFKKGRTLSGEEAQQFFKRLERNEVLPEECVRIVGLDLSSSWIRYLPSSIGMLTNLEELKLPSNALRRLPAEFGSLANLREVDLSSNSFFDFPLELTLLPNLVSLNMGGNFLKGFPEEIAQLSQLKTLDFYRNWFIDFPPQICCLENLTNLDASYNQFSSLPRDFSRLKHLEKIDLNSTYIREVPEYFSQFDALTTLDLSYNRLYSPLPLSAIEKWIERGVFLREVSASFDAIMKMSIVNLLETRIVGCPKEIMLSNDLQRIRAQY